MTQECLRLKTTVAQLTSAQARLKEQLSALEVSVSCSLVWVGGWSGSLDPGMLRSKHHRLSSIHICTGGPERPTIGNLSKCFTCLGDGWGHGLEASTQEYRMLKFTIRQFTSAQARLKAQLSSVEVSVSSYFLVLGG